MSENDNKEVLSIELMGISVSSVYKPPIETFSLSVNVVIGDVNIHSVTWGYGETNEEGESVENWADANQMSLIHDAKLPYTFNSCMWRRGYNTDLMFVYNNIANQCEVLLDPIPHSQHRPIGLKVNAVIKPRAVPFRRRFNLKKAHWRNFAKDTDSYIKDLPALLTHYGTFVEMIKRSSRRNIPRGCRTTYTPGMTDDSKVLYSDYEKHFQCNPFSADTLECGENLTKAITESRRKKWQELVQSTDMTHSRRKAWKTIRMLGNDQTKSQPRPLVTANEVTHQLIVNSRGNPDHLSRRVKLPKAADTCSHRGPSYFMRPFSINDLSGAIKDMKNNKAAGLDDILCEQIKHLRSAALQWLLEVLNECMRTNNIPKIWRKSRVVALLKPCKDPASPKSYRPISLLCHTYTLFKRLILNRVAPFVDEHLIPEQACFIPGKSCTSQLLNLTQFIEDGYEEGVITVAAFVDLSAAYDTVNHIIITRKLFEITQDVRLTELIQNMLSNIRVYVDLFGQRSRWRRQKNGLSPSSVLAPLLFNIYTNDLPFHPNTRSFLYADDMCIATQKQSFEEVEKTLGDALAGLTPYYAANHLRANPEKTQTSTFYLKNRDAQRELKVVWHGRLLAYSHKPIYIGVTLDRCLAYKDHITKTKAKTGARNSILKKLANTNWGTDAGTIPTTALALCFSSAEYASIVWSRSSHASKIDPVLNAACRAISGCLRQTRVDDVYLLCGIAPPHIRPAVSSQLEKLKQENDPLHPQYEQDPARKRLKSRHSFLHSVEPLMAAPALED